MANLIPDVNCAEKHLRAEFTAEKRLLWLLQDAIDQVGHRVKQDKPTDVGRVTSPCN